MVFRWANELYGNRAALFATFLYSICPNNLSHAGLITTDAYSVLCLLVTSYYLWKFCLEGKEKYFLLLSLFVAVSQLVKQSLFHLYILVPLCLIIYYIAHRTRSSFKKVLYRITVFIFINWTVINLGYYFYHT